jgi:hypothetical protein
MQSRKLLVTMTCAVAAVAAAPTAWSDSPCYKGYRDTTPAERATMTAVLQAAKKALPPAPTGWVILGDDQISVTTSLCRDYEGAPWSYQFNREYQRVDDQAARDKIIADAGAASNAAYELKKPRLDAAMARIEKISARQVALIQKGDMAGAVAIDDEMAKAQEDYKKILDEGDSEEQFAAAAAKAGHDMTMNINLAVNSNQAMPDASATSLALPPGARAAFQWNTTREQITEGHALILLGQWQRYADGSWKRVLHPEMAPTAAQVISINVTADPERLTAILGSIDVKSLAAMVPN